MKRTKYVLVDRGSEYKNTAVTVKVAEDMIQCGIATSYTPVTVAQIKAERIHIFEEKHYFQYKAEDAFAEAYNGKQYKATVLSWDDSRGQGFVTIHGTDLRFQDIYACNIKGKKTWYPETACVSYEKDQVIDVELKVFSGAKLFVNGLTEGKLDTEKWDGLKKEDLAFRCDEDGNAVTGLFKKVENE